MNHLAHAFLALRAGGSVTGNLMGDFVKGRPHGRYGGAILEGILLHRRVDAFAQAHGAVRCSRRRVHPPRRRYAGILVDLFYDHFLATHWREFSAQPLEEFARAVYRELEASRAILPAPMGRFVDFMRARDLLTSYRDIRGIECALHGLARRLRRPNPLAGPLVEFDEGREDFERDFWLFFPELLEEVARPEARRDRLLPGAACGGTPGREDRGASAVREEEP